MKQKLTLNSLVRSNLKHRRKQYALMFSGILLSMILSSTVLFFVSSLPTSAKEYSKVNYGNFDSFLYGEGVDKSFYEDAKQSGTITDYGFAHTIGKLFKEKDGEDFKISVGYLDESCKELYYVSLLEGAYPSAPGEIALEKTTAAALVPDAKVGDTVTLFLRGQNGNHLLEGYTKKSFVLVGILRNKMANITAYTSDGNINYVPTAFVSDSRDALPGSKTADVAYVKHLKDGAKKTAWHNLVISEMGKGNIELYELNELQASFFNGDKTGFLMIVGVIFAVVLLFASFIGIINAMNSNIADRKKQIGMLRTVGATKRQIRKIFGREAVVISFICAPISAAVSYFLVKLISELFGEEFVFVLNVPVLLLSVAFGVLCVRLASSIPLLRASRISPVQSIRNIDITRKMKTKRIKSKMRFNMSKLLAKRNVGFYRTKQVVVSIFLVVTIVISCFGFSLLRFETESERNTISPDYSVSNTIAINEFYNLRSDTGFSETKRQDISNIPYIANVSGRKESYGFIEHEGSSEYFNTFIKSGGSVVGYSESNSTDEIKMYCKTDSELFGIIVSSSDEDSLKSLKPYLTDGKINMEALNSGKEVILLAPDKVAYCEKVDGNGVSYSWFHVDEQISKQNNYIATAERNIGVGDKFTLDILYGDMTKDYEPENIELLKSEVQIGAHIKSLPPSKQYSMHLYDNIYLITSHEGMRKLCGDVGYRYFSANLSDSARETLTEEVDNEIMSKINLLKVNTNGFVQCSSNFQLKNENERTFNIVFLVIISMMILLLAGSISIINNSLTARIRENKREIGTLRAVGATQKDLTMSYVRQLLSMFGWGTGLGFGVFLLTYAGVQLYGKIMKTTTGLSLSVVPAIIATLILFAVCSLNLYLKIKKETKNSIIDNIREL